MNSNYRLISSVHYIRPLYFCKHCPNIGEGNMVRVADADLKDFQPTGNSMPSGWAINGIGNYQCPDCIRKEKEDGSSETDIPIS